MRYPIIICIYIRSRWDGRTGTDKYISTASLISALPMYGMVGQAYGGSNEEIGIHEKEHGRGKLSYAEGGGGDGILGSLGIGKNEK